MTGFTADVPEFTLIWTGIVQGFGLGFFFVPLNTVTFSTMASEHRTEAAGLFNLMRNMGSSIGISVVVSLLIRGTQANHEELRTHLHPFNELMDTTRMPESWSLTESAGLLAMNHEVARQAAAIAYINDFKLLMIVTLLAIPLLLFLRDGRERGPSAAPTT
jgi:DHA2 family multidrug resistance protein